MLRACSILFLLLISFSLHARECISLVTARDAHQHPFWDELIDGAISASDELGIDLYYRGAVTEDRQHLIVDYLVKTYACAGMVIAPAGFSLKAKIEELNRQGVAVTFIDRDIGGGRAAVVESDNLLGGVIAAQKMAQQLDGRKNIALLRMKKGIPSTQARESGFMKEARRLGMNIVVNKFVGVTMAEARGEAFAIFSNHSEIDGVFTSTGIITEAVLRVLEGGAPTKGPVHIGFDESDYLIQQVREGKLHGYVKQEPFDIGYQGVYTTFNILNKREYQERTEIPVVFIKASDLVPD